jgi:hypothetical protein
MKFSLLVVLAVAVCLGSSREIVRAENAPAANSDLVHQVQAAYLLADLITYTVDRADQQLQAAQGFVQKSGKWSDYLAAHAAPPSPRPLNYMLLFRGSLALVEGSGAKYADESVNDEPAQQLYQDLTAAQYYNMHEFLHFNQQRMEYASIRAYLQSSGLNAAYASSSESAGEEDHSADAAATQPAPTTPAGVAQRMDDLIAFIRETAWKQAQAKGMSREDFDKQWPDQVKQYRQEVMAKIENAQPVDDQFGRTGAAGTVTASTSQPSAGASASAAGPGQPQTVYIQSAVPSDPHVLPPPVYSPYSNERFRSRDLRLWDMWDFNRRY